MPNLKLKGEIEVIFINTKTYVCNSNFERKHRSLFIIPNPTYVEVLFKSLRPKADSQLPTATFTPKHTTHKTKIDTLTPWTPPHPPPSKDFNLIGGSDCCMLYNWC